VCGILGGWFPNPAENTTKKFEISLNLLGHRGPDDRGYEVIRAGYSSEILFGHTRLSIIDLSSLGHQPMTTSDGRMTIVFNGEIYNYKELRKELIEQGHKFTTNSDTEVLLIAWDKWGKDALPKLVGMFAFAIYDRAELKLTLVRDPFGIKPLFYSHSKSNFVFSSEIHSLLPLIGHKAKIDLQSSYDYLVNGDYDSSERTFIDGVKHLRPGHYLVLDLQNPNISEPKQWWKPRIDYEQGLSFSQAAEMLRAQFLENVRFHLRSDVPVGTALSGGIDSSSVVCAMRYIEPDMPIHTFSYIAHGSVISEEKWVDRVNNHVDAISHKVEASASGLAQDLDDLIKAQGEPFGSTSIYAQYRVFKLAKESGIKVTLDGQGADELLAGYNGYPGERLLSLLEQKKILASLKFSYQWQKWPGRSYKQSWMYLGKKVLPEMAFQYTRKAMGRDYFPAWLNTNMLFESGVILKEIRPSLSEEGKTRRVIEQLAYSLQNRGLPALLRLGDRNSMHFSIESRVPFLTTGMADLLYSLPENYLISDNGQTKYVFREAMRGIVPNDILDRRDKIGFETPQNDWLISMAPLLRGWLMESDEVPFINREALLKSFDLIVSGKAPFTWQVWRWVNFVRWYSYAFM
jgi:asparagine synthase (glutamine-hydrolysing)